MNLNLHQTNNASIYIGDAEFLYGTVNDFKYHLGYQFGWLAACFFVGHLIALPDTGDLDIAAYFTVAKHHIKQPEGLDIQKIKAFARENV